MLDGLSDRVQRPPVAQQLGVASVDGRQRGVQFARVERPHDLPALGMTVGLDERQVGAQGHRVGLGVGPVAGRGALGEREEPVPLVVAHRLGRDAVLAGQIERAQVLHGLRL